MLSKSNKYPCALYLLLAIILVASGCAAPVRHDGGKAPIVAVITGVPEEASRKIATTVAESLQLQSKQRVMTDALIATKLTNYPRYIPGPYQRAYFEIEVDWSHTDMNRIAAIQRELGADFLYVIWAPNAIRNGSLSDYLVWTPADIKAVDIDRIEVPIIVQLFATPGNKVVMKEQYKICLDESSKPKKEFMDSCDSIDKIALKLGKETGLMKGWW